MNCKNCGAEMPDGTDFCLSCGVNQSEIKPKMGWYAFLTYFSIPFSAFCSFFVGVIHMPNVAFNVLSMVDVPVKGDFIFLDRTEFKIMFFIAGIIEFAFAAYYVNIFYSLFKYKKKTLTHLCVQRILYFIFYIIYMAAWLVLMRDMSVSANIFGSTLTAFFRNIASQLTSTLFWLWVNIKYFNNRKHLFIN